MNNRYSENRDNTYTLMLFLVCLCQPHAFVAEVLLHGRVQRELFGERMPCHCPCELIAPPYFLSVVGGSPQVVCIFVERSVVGSDGLLYSFAHVRVLRDSR